MTLQLKFILRYLFRNRTSTIINIVGLSLGLICFSVLTSFVRYELSFDKHHALAERTFRINQQTKFGEETSYWNTTAYPLANALRSDFSEFQFVTQTSGPVNRLFKVESGTDVKRFDEPNVLFVDQFYPKVFDLELIAGNLATAFHHPNSIVITEGIAKKFFGEVADESTLLGKQVFLNNKDALTVTAIIEDCKPASSLRYTILIPYEFFRINNPYFASNWSGNYQGTTFVVPQEGQSPKSIKQKIHTWKKRYLKPEDDQRISYHLQPLTTIHTDDTYGSSPMSYTISNTWLVTAFLIGVLIILLACVNFINLTTAQASTRAKEVGVKKILGGSKSNLIRQFLLEGSFYIFSSVMVAISAVPVILDSINDGLTIVNISLAFTSEDFIFIIAAGLAILFLACLYPATMVASFRPVAALKTSTQNSTTTGVFLRRTLIVSQFFIVQMFIIGSIIAIAQLRFLFESDLGFFHGQPVIITSNNDGSKAELIRKDLLSRKEISEVTFASSAPQSDYNHHYGTSFRLPGQSETDGHNAEMKGVDQNYISFFKLQLLAGRNFTEVKTNPGDVIVNEELIRALQWTPEEAIGQKIVMNEGEIIIIGVVADFHNNSLHDPITPCILTNWQPFLERAHLKPSSPDDILTAASIAETTFKKYYPESIYQHIYLDESMARNYVFENLLMNGFIVVSILSLIIGSLGLYGLLAYITLKKRKEVGIRKVLGASVFQILKLIHKEVAVLILLSFLLAVPFVAQFMNEWLAGFAYKVSLSWWMFAAGALITYSIVAGAVGYHTLTAASANPIDSLKNE